MDLDECTLESFFDQFRDVILYLEDHSLGIITDIIKSFRTLLLSFLLKKSFDSFDLLQIM